MGGAKVGGAEVGGNLLQQAKHNRFHAGPPAWIERKFTFLLRLFKLKMSEYTLKIGICRN